MIFLPSYMILVPSNLTSYLLEIPFPIFHTQKCRYDRITLFLNLFNIKIIHLDLLKMSSLYMIVCNGLFVDRGWSRQPHILFNGLLSHSKPPSKLLNEETKETFPFPLSPWFMKISWQISKHPQHSALHTDLLSNKFMFVGRKKTLLIQMTTQKWS